MLRLTETQHGAQYCIPVSPAPWKQEDHEFMMWAIHENFVLKGKITKI